MGGAMVAPVHNFRISSPYGPRILNVQDPVTKQIVPKKQFHDGIDFVSKSNDNRVLAIADGIVTYDMDDYEEAKRWTDRHDSGGNMLVLSHIINGVQYYARYLHLEKNLVSKNDFIKQGTLLGNYADVGFSFGAHLHFDLYDRKWKKLDPTPILAEVLA